MDTSTVVILLILGIYFLPGIIASGRQHPNSIAIFLLNLFLGWTFLGWFAALIWSATAKPLNVKRGW